MPIVTGNVGSSPVSFARVHRAATINNWDGSTIPFDVVDVDADGLWDAANHQFLAKRAGWYQVMAFPTAGGGGITFPTVIAASINAQVSAVVFGSGDNITLDVFEAAEAAGPHTAYFPTLVGNTHLAAADAVVIQGDGGTGWTVTGGFTFSIYGPIG